MRLTNLTEENSVEFNLFHSIVNLGENSGNAFIILDKSFHIVYQNNAHLLLTNFPFEVIYNRHFSITIGNSKTVNCCAQLGEAMRTGTMVEMTHLHKKWNASAFTAKITCLPFQVDGQTEWILLFVEDVSKKKIDESISRLEQQFIHSQDQSIHFNQKLEQICSELNLIMDPHCFATIVWLHHNMLTLYANHHKEHTATKWISQMDPRYALYVQLIMEQSNELPTYLTDFELTNRLSTYNKKSMVLPIKLSTGERKGAIILYFNDPSFDTKPFHHVFEKLSSLVEYSYHLEQQKITSYIPAFLDPSLQIPNRHGMQYVLSQQMDTLKDKQLSVALISLSEYMNVIELYGRDAGELLLNEMIKRIKKWTDYNQVLIGRFSSSTLYVIFAGQFDFNQLSKWLHKKMSNPMLLNDRLIYLTVKIGIASQQKDDCIEETARHAEIALSKVRNKSGTQLGLYDEEYANQIQKDLILLNHLTAAINNKEIQVYFQPKVELHRGRIDSIEALARWHSPTLGFISPAEFIPVAEKNGLIHSIDVLIIEQVLAWMQQRQYEGKKIVPVSVNISAEHFYHPEFIDQLMELVHKYYADPKYLIIEITETLGLEDVERAQKIINRLAVLGFTVSVDDFGIGYSSLSYLQKLHFRELKIDMSFVRRLDEGGTRAIVRAIIDIAKHLEMRVIAEGVETKEQVSMLKELSCDVAQGYLYYKPMPIDAIDF